MQTEPPNAEPPKRKRRWFQFSLRTQMILKLICGVRAGWLGRNIERKREDREAVDAILKLGPAVEFDRDISDLERTATAKRPGPRRLPPPCEPTIR